VRDEAAHRGNGERRVENDAGAVVFCPYYTRKKARLQSPNWRGRACMRLALALTGAGEGVAAWGQWLAARLGLALVVAGDHLAAAALRLECAA